MECGEAWQNNKAQDLFCGCVNLTSDFMAQFQGRNVLQLMFLNIEAFVQNIMEFSYAVFRSNFQEYLVTDLIPERIFVNSGTLTPINLIYPDSQIVHIIGRVIVWHCKQLKATPHSITNSHQLFGHNLFIDHTECWPNLWKSCGA